MLTRISSEQGLALTTLDTQLSSIEAELAQLQEQVLQKKALRKAIADKKKLAIKAVSKLDAAIEQINSAFEELGEAGKELKEIAIAKVKSFLPTETAASTLSACVTRKREIQSLKEEDSSLADFPKRANDRGELFAWQPTSNPLVASYFNIGKGKVQATYLGGNNKNRLKGFGDNLSQIIPGISFEIRTAQRFETKYELKIRGLGDDEIGWLTGFDLSKDFAPQFASKIKRKECQGELQLSEGNWIANPGALIENRFFDCECFLIESDNFGMGIAENQKGDRFDIYLDDWLLTKECQREIDFTYRAIVGCKSKKELEIIKASNQVNADTLAFVWRYMPSSDKAKIKALCDARERDLAR